MMVQSLKNIKISELEIEVHFKRIKNIYLRVKPDRRLVISAPIGTKKSVLKKMVENRLDWITANISRVAEKIDPIGEEKIMLWGCFIPMSTVEGQKQVKLTKYGLVANVKRDVELCVVLDNWLREELANKVKQLAEMWQPKIGRSASKFKIRQMTSRWGTCNTRSGVITINLKLVHLRPELVEYVLVHELTHLHEAGHGIRFRQLMDSFLPQWRMLKRELNNCQI